MAMYEPTFLPPNAEEQDFIQAYENVREKYKGERASASHRCRHFTGIWQAAMTLGNR